MGQKSRKAESETSMTHTLVISEKAFNEIADDLMRAGHEEAIILGNDHEISLNMHGLVLIRKAPNVVNFPVVPELEKSELLKGLE